MTTEMLSLERLCVDLPGAAGPVAVLREVSLSLAPGACVVVLGESGSGKTLALQAALGLAPVAARVSGRLQVDGVEHDLARPAGLAALRGRVIGCVSQQAGASLTPHLTLRRQLTGVLATHRNLTGAAAEAEARRLLETVSIAEAGRRLGQYPHELSGGLQQRAALALALAGAPRYLFADEPTTALDATLQAEVVALLRQLARDAGLGILFVTHDAGLVAGLAQRVVVMYAGGVVEEADAGTLLRSPRHPYAAALLAARPRLDAARGTLLATIPGQPPAPGARPAGCAFAPRCARVLADCAQRPPELVTAADGSRVACHRPLGGAGA